ncbi:MAG: hypothetical protein HGB22_04280 [Chlorobiaceae bacterium]|nr:hypothetical protein [Chlorobiaceae bacterium]
MGEETTVRNPGQTPAVLVGATLIALTSFVPYLNLINVFPFAGIILSGAVAAWFYIIRHQVPLSYRQAFLLGAKSGFLGGSFILFVVYLMLEQARNLSVDQFRKLLTDWGGRMPSDSADMYQQIMMIVNAPFGIKLVSFLVSMVLIGLILGPLAGIGARLTVYILKKQAQRNTPTP